MNKSQERWQEQEKEQENEQEKEQEKEQGKEEDGYEKEEKLGKEKVLIQRRTRADPDFHVGCETD